MITLFRMARTFYLTVGRDGRLKLPAGTCARFGWSAGTTLIATECDNGVVLTQRGEALKAIRAQLADKPVLEELFDERRRQAALEDEGMA